jgi:hypothetical protein
MAPAAMFDPVIVADAILPPVIVAEPMWAPVILLEEELIFVTI